MIKKYIVWTRTKQNKKSKQYEIFAPAFLEDGKEPDWEKFRNFVRSNDASALWASALWEDASPPLVQDLCDHVKEEAVVLQTFKILVEEYGPKILVRQVLSADIGPATACHLLAMGGQCQTMQWILDNHAKDVVDIDANCPHFGSTLWIASLPCTC